MDKAEKGNECKSCTMKGDESNEIRCELQQVNGYNVELAEQQDDITNLKENSQESESNHSTNTAKCSNSTNDETLVKKENSEIITKEKVSEAIPSKTSISSSSLSSKNMLESSLSSSSSSSNGNNAISNVQGECRTSVLIKKQMNEIDKEINRRIQNRNIKKVCFEF
ncbi:hypothetical protein LOAG_07086 [Loa loa]|uniref:Uncharacterized protein n=1 Tax=Loa loa TaxID=7209 RepID=A0A1S0TWH9_LOALO|nr:hypothetical protein LOAG_07086 [Loa loa]EFO21402.1 hypothetical protein LOAG_07086 [Loa loa]